MASFYVPIGGLSVIEAITAVAQRLQPELSGLYPERQEAWGRLCDAVYAGRLRACVMVATPGYRVEPEQADRSQFAALRGLDPLGVDLTSIRSSSGTRGQLFFWKDDVDALFSEGSDLAKDNSRAIKKPALPESIARYLRSKYDQRPSKSIEELRREVQRDAPEIGVFGLRTLQNGMRRAWPKGS